MNYCQRKDNEQAVSPVVGVMLMLVVTIIIAAVVSAFAGGLSSDVKETPQVSIEVKISNTSGYNNEANAEFKLLSGDPIPTKDIAIITYYTNKTGGTYRHEQTLASPGSDLYSSYPGYIARVPFLNDMRNGYAGNNPAVDFGNYTWKVGDTLVTNAMPGTADLLGINDDSSPHKFLPEANFEPGAVVDVKILHIPSGRYIFDKEVVVS